MAIPSALEIARLGEMQRANSPLAQLGQLVQGGFNAYQQGAANKERRQAAQQAKTGQAKSANFIRLAVENPEEQEKYMLNAYEADPEFFTGFMQANKLKSEGMQSKERGEGALVWDSKTSSYSIDPVAKEYLEGKARAKAQEGGKLGVKDIQGINKDVTALTKDVGGITKAASTLESLKDSSSPAAKLAAVFAFMKSIDPTSVVRESEQGQVYSAQGAAKQLTGKLNSLLGEGELSDDGFEDLVNTAYVMANSAIDSSSNEIDNYLGVYGDTLPEDIKGRIKSRVPKKFNKKQEQGSGAPQAAIDYLKSNPDAASAFKAKYGYLPEGM